MSRRFLSLTLVLSAFALAYVAGCDRGTPPGPAANSVQPAAEHPPALLGVVDVGDQDPEELLGGVPLGFLEDLAEELGHPYYPEVRFALQGTQPVLLGVSDTLADDTLMEPPVATSAEEGAHDPLMALSGV